MFGIVKLKLYLFFIVISINLAAAETENDQMFSKGHHWASYKQTIGVEHISAKFPKSPKIAAQNTLFYTSSHKKHASYTLIAGAPPIGGIQSDEAFPVHLASQCQYPYDLVDYRISHEPGKEILDTVCYNEETNLIVKSRMIVTNRNFYILRTTVSAGEKEEHEYFIKSFSVGY